MKKEFLYIGLSVFMFCSCRYATTETALNQGSETARNSLIEIVKELHALECKYLAQEGIASDTFSTYDFRAAAFQEILKEKNRKILVGYEDLYQELASLQHDLNEMELKEFEKEVDEVYRKGCQ